MQTGFGRILALHLQHGSLLRRDESVVVGVSGGADSMALLHMLMRVNAEPGWELRLHLAHLNHQLRNDESEKDATFVLAAADHLNLPCTVESVDITAAARHGGIGMEEAARRERYSFFERTSRKVGASAVVVGHHADDQAETILHRIARGTGLRGLAGMAASRALSAAGDIRLVRPLLMFKRDDLRRFLADEGMAYRDDRSNQSNEPMRNRIRNLVIPLMEEQINPQVREALTRIGEQARWLRDFLAETVESTFSALTVSRNDQSLSLHVEGLARKSRIVQTELIRTAYRAFGLGEQDLTFAHIVAVLDVIDDPVDGRPAQLPGGMTVEKMRGQVVFSAPSETPREQVAPEVVIHLPGITPLPMRNLQIECSIVDVEVSAIGSLKRQGGPLQESMDFDAVHPPLVVRGRRPGDRFFPLGAPGAKKVSDFLADAKVLAQERDRAVLLCDQLGLIWLIGRRIDDRVKLTALTRRVLRVTARPLP